MDKRHKRLSGTVKSNCQSQLAGATTVLSAVGFSSSGVVAGTAAAAMQSSVRLRLNKLIVLMKYFFHTSDSDVALR